MLTNKTRLLSQTNLSLKNNIDLSEILDLEKAKIYRQKILHIDEIFKLLNFNIE